MTTTTPHNHRRVRVGTIVWSAILVAVAVFAFLAAEFGIGPSGPAALLRRIVGFGALLVVTAIATAAVRAIASTGSASDGHQPID